MTDKYRYYKIHLPSMIFRPIHYLCATDYINLSGPIFVRKRRGKPTLLSGDPAFRKIFGYADAAVFGNRGKEDVRIHK